ncbi:hypothetical protein F4825DRAFT_433881 [Nemania diffusa]|nr:hypothetical protein F4825DRAFT_433881 [Nemania diffusa]
MLLSPSIEEDSSLTTTNSECTAFISEVAVHEYEDQGLLPARSRNDSRFSIYNIALLCVLTHLMSLFYVGIIYASLRGHIFQNACEGQHFEVYSPARNALEYESRLVDGKLEDNPFVLAPGPESNAAWHSLLQGTIVKVTAEELAQAGLESLALKDGTGYLATLGVYHELHCIKRLRMWFYQDVYYSNLTEAAYAETRAHTEHCLDFVRQSAVCHGDVSLAPYRWLQDHEGHVIGPTMEPGGIHKCVRWDSLSGWAEHRMVDISDSSTIESV